MKRKVMSHYCPPETEVLGSEMKTLLCDSPVDGGLESVEYEDWVI